MEIHKLNKVLSLLNDCHQIVSIDLFSTLCQEKIEDKILLKQSVRTFFNEKSLLVSEYDFINKFDETFNKNMEIKTNLFIQSSPLIDIFRVIFKKLKIDMVNLFEFCDFVFDKKLNNLKLVDDAIDLLVALKAREIKVVVLSKLPYSHYHLQKMLTHLGINNIVDVIYSDSNFEPKVYTKKFFENILKVENILPGQFFYLGGNPSIDTAELNNIGINSAFVGYKKYAHVEMNKQVLYDFGYEILAPLLLSFISNLVNRNNRDNIYLFLGRDGFMLKEVFDLYPHETLTESAPTAHYIYLNRMLSNQLTTPELVPEVLSYIDAQFKSEGIWGLVTVFGLNDTNFSKFLSTFLTKNKFNKNAFIDAPISKLLLGNTRLKELFSMDIRARKANVNNYLHRYFPKYKGQCITFVDVGWRGSIFKQLSPYYPEITDCYLMGYMGEESDNIEAFIGKKNKYAPYLHLLSEYRDLIEYFLSEGVSNVIGIDNKLTAIYLNNNNAHLNSEREIVQTAIKEHCKNRLTLKNKSHESDLSLERFNNFFTSLPACFHSALGSIHADINIQDDSTVKIQELLPSIHNRSEVHNNGSDLQSMIYGYLSLIKELQRETEIIVYGSGSGADFILPHLIDNVKCIVDLNKKVHGNKLMNIPIRSVDALSELNGAVIVTVLGRKNQILETLSSFDVKVFFLEEYL